MNTEILSGLYDSLILNIFARNSRPMAKIEIHEELEELLENPNLNAITEVHIAVDRLEKKRHIEYIGEGIPPGKKTIKRLYQISSSGIHKQSKVLENLEGNLLPT